MSNNSYSSYKKSLQDDAKKKSAGRKSFIREEKSSSPKQIGMKKNSSASQKPESKKAKQKKFDKTSRRSKEEKKRLSALKKQEKAAARRETWASFAVALKEFIVRMWLVLAVIFILIGIIGTITLKSEIDLLKFENNELTSQLEQRKEVIKELNSKKEATYKSETIENIARYKLGMVYPTKEQTVYIYLD